VRPGNCDCSARKLRWSRSYTSYAHLAGTKADRLSAQIVHDQWSELLNLPKSKHNHRGFVDAGTRQAKRLMTDTSLGDRVWVDTYYSVSAVGSRTSCQTKIRQLLNYPTNTSTLELRAQDGRSLFNASLTEDTLDEDSTSREGNTLVPPFHGFSKAGSAKGQLVYANVGVLPFECLGANSSDPSSSDVSKTSKSSSAAASVSREESLSSATAASFAASRSPSPRPPAPKVCPAPAI
jgi:hypothetical protein